MISPHVLDDLVSAVRLKDTHIMRLRALFPAYEPRVVANAYYSAWERLGCGSALEHVWTDPGRPLEAFTNYYAGKALLAYRNAKAGLKGGD